MPLNAEALATTMFDAAFAVLKTQAPKIGAHARLECTKIAQTIAMIESEHALKQISDDESKILMDMQRSATRSVFLSAEGLGLLMTERAINAAMDAARPIVNAALGFALL